MRLPKVCRMFQGWYDLLGTSEINFFVIFVIVRLTLFCLLSMAPCCSKRSIIILLPRLQAIWSGVHPFYKENKQRVNCVVFRKNLRMFLNVKQTTHFQFDLFTPISAHKKKQTNLSFHSISQSIIADLCIIGYWKQAEYLKGVLPRFPGPDRLRNRAIVVRFLFADFELQCGAAYCRSCL